MLCSQALPQPQWEEPNGTVHGDVCNPGRGWGSLEEAAKGAMRPVAFVVLSVSRDTHSTPSI